MKAVGVDRGKVRIGQTGPPPMDPAKQYVNPGEEDQMEIYGYTRSMQKTALTWISIVLSVGIIRLVFHWRPDWMLRCTHSKCPLRKAQAVLLKDQYHQWFVAQVQTITKDGTRVTVIPERVSFFNRDTVRTSLVNDPLQDETLIRFFRNKKIKYIWDGATEKFNKLEYRGLDERLTCAFFHECEGLSIHEQARRRVLYGANRIQVHVSPILKILFLQVLNPFYIFQIFSCTLWYFDEYWYYASCIVLISGISIVTFIYQTRKMQRKLRQTIQASGEIDVCRGGDDYQKVSSEDLVPGDVIEIPRHGCVMMCDAVLISGNCIVNESMLTGESVPVTKTPIPNPKLGVTSSNAMMFNMKDHSRHVLFCGTKVIQTRYYGSQRVKAVVIRTGFMTAKGELVRSILYPKPADFRFTQDTYKFVGVLASLAFCGLVFTAILMGLREDEIGDIFLRSLDLLTIAVPPALPAALTIGTVFAQQRLKKKSIYCISPANIPVSGSVNVVCFDKTGTLTEDGLDMWGVLPTDTKGFVDVVHYPCQLPKDAFLIAMASCHSLTIIEGELSGDPLDLKMFESTDWELDEPGEEDTTKFDIMAPTVVRPKQPDLIQSSNLALNEPAPFEVGIVRQFTFSSSLQRMSVIARILGQKNFNLYTKGAPETIAGLCKAETVPDDFHEVLLHYTQLGYRVIALAWKALPAKINYVKTQRMARGDVERDLDFLGLLVMENRLKPETTPVIQCLKSAAIKTIMVTGDNMLTALSVARDCEMIDSNHKVILVNAVPPSAGSQAGIQWVYAEDARKDVEEIHIEKDLMNDSTSIKIDEDNKKFHFAVTGKSWAIIKHHYPDLLVKLAVRGAVFARMSPDQKAQLVEVLQQLGYYVAMCGDGANDCGALKTAHTGISLSEAEASVASPFTSKHQNIECVPTTIREGRAALTTTFGIFKYMACYSLTQFTSVLILYWISNNLTDFEFLYIDLLLLTTLSISFSRTEAFSHLTSDQVQVSLIAIQPILSLMLQMVIQIIVQTTMYFVVQQQEWFVAFVPNEEDEYASYENSAVFYVSAFQYITLAIVFSKGAPFRKTLFSNYFFLANLFIVTAITIWITLYPLPFMVDLIELKVPPTWLFRVILLGVAAVNFLASFILESFILDGYIRHKFARATANCITKTPYKYMQVEQEICSSPNWPPVSESTADIAHILRTESNMPTADTAVPIGNSIESGSQFLPSDQSFELGSSKSSNISYRTALEPHQEQGNHPTVPYSKLDNSAAVETDDVELTHTDKGELPPLQLNPSDVYLSRGLSVETSPLVDSEIPPLADGEIPSSPDPLLADHAAFYIPSTTTESHTTEL